MDDSSGSLLRAMMGRSGAAERRRVILGANVVAEQGLCLVPDRAGSSVAALVG